MKLPEDFMLVRVLTLHIYFLFSFEDATIGWDISLSNLKIFAPQGVDFSQASAFSLQPPLERIYIIIAYR